MTTGYYLLDHPNRTQQYRHPRRARLSGMVGVHTTEGVMDNLGADLGAENTAHYITTRTDYGSYHRIVDSGGTVNMAPDDHETWHIGADAHNWHSWGISAACRSTDWDPGSPWTRTVIGIMGAEIRAFWVRNGFDPAKCARWLTRAQALAHEPGLIHHGVAQPSDRSDAWVLHPQRAVLDRMLIDAIVGAEPPTPEPKDWLDMATEAEVEAIVRRVVQEEIGNQDKRMTAAIVGPLNAVLDQLDPRRNPNDKPRPIRDLVEPLHSAAVTAGFVKPLD